MQNVFEVYRPLRNAFRSYQLNDTLAVVQAYSQNLAYRVPFPPGLEVLPHYTDPAVGIKQWELEIIAREAIAHAPRYQDTRKTLRRGNHLAALLNKLRLLEHHIASLTVNQDNVLTELHRIGHRQFEWQSDMPNAQLVLRYYKIFSQPAMDAIVTERIGLDTRMLHLIGMLLTGIYAQQFALPYPPTFLLESRNNVTAQQLDTFLGHFSRPVSDVSRRLCEEIQANLNENYAYFFDALRMYPLLDMPIAGRRSLVAPLPVLLTWRYTRGLFYELFGHPRFAAAFGAAFQAYIGAVLADLFHGSEHMLLPEEPTANNRGIASSDWFLMLQDAALVVETKTKRMGLAAKITLNDTTKLEIELEKLADGVLQTYKCIDAIRRGALVGHVYDALGTKQLYPIIVTLESWHLFGPTWGRLNELVQQRLSRAGLPVEWTESMPYTACDINEFEQLARAIRHVGRIEDILDQRVTDATLREHELLTYLINHQRAALQSAPDLFPHQFDNMFA